MKGQMMITEDDHRIVPALSAELEAASDVREINRAKEKTFAKKLSKAGWWTYTDEDTGRIVTNAHDHEVAKLAKISGMPCEIVGAGWDGGAGKVGPVLSGLENQQFMDGVCRDDDDKANARTA